MASLKDLRNRIGSVKSTQKITRAMQMVAAAKLRKAQEAAEAARPYAERIENVIANLAEARKGDASAPRLMTGTGADQRHLLIVATADRGLCGGFNTNIVRKAREHLAELSRQGKEFQILCVGKKGFDLLKRLYGDKIIDTIDLTLVRKVSFENAAEISGRVLEMFEDGKFDICTLFYGQFKNVITQVPTAQQIIPVKAPEGATPPDLKGAAYEFEPDEEEILATLLPRFVSVQILRALLENRASEMGAKMTAMDNATRNAGELIDKLTITYNRTRQAQITKELIEIISGAEAL
ncbi:MAG: F0F1 ATP synthase subunit gamma [Parvularculaceae bacterium]